MHNLYREKGCMKKFCTFLREHATNVISFEKKVQIETFLVSEVRRQYKRV